MWRWERFTSRYPSLLEACLQKGLSIVVAVAAGLLAGVVLSLACELMNHWRLERRGAADSAHLISSLGIYIVVVQALALKWGNDSQVLRGRGCHVYFGQCRGDTRATLGCWRFSGDYICVFCGYDLPVKSQEIVNDKRVTL